MHCCNTVCSFLSALLDQPLTLCLMLLITAILCGVGSAAGLPRLFWHEHRIPALLAGLATTLFFAEGFLVTYLLEGESGFPLGAGCERFSACAAVSWLLLIAAGVGVQVTGSAGTPGASGTEGKAFRAKRIGPALRINAQTALVRPSSPLWPLPLGAALGTGLLFLGWRVIWWIPSFDWLRPLIRGTPAWIPAQAHAAAFFSFVAFGLVFVILRRHATGAVAICVLLGLVVGGLGFLSLHVHPRAAGPGILLVMLWIGGRRMRKLRIPALADLYAKPVSYPPAAGKRLVPPLLAYDAPLWAAHHGKPGPLIVICTSGGGIRAATWTAAILGRLDQLPCFRASARLIAGASGGMVGTAFWMAQPEADKLRGWDSLMNCVAMDSLTPVARQLVFRDVPWAFLPLNNARDRSRVLEETWTRNARDCLAGAKLDQPLSSFSDREASGDFPSAVFSPMMVEDGRRLILSNLDLRAITNNQVRWLSGAGAPGPAQGLASQSAYHLAELMPDHWPGFPLATAARLSAAFSYVSPAVLLPTQPRRRVVDAGYYDNYGLSLACGWLRSLLVKHGTALKDHVSSILVIQIRDNVSELSVNPEDRLDPTKAPPNESTSWLGRGLEGLTSPPEGLLSARDSVMLFRNDADLQATSQLYREVFQRDVVNTTAFEFGGEASLSWYLADDEIAIIRQQAESVGITGKLTAIQEWLEKYKAVAPAAS